MTPIITTRFCPSVPDANEDVEAWVQRQLRADTPPGTLGLMHTALQRAHARTEAEGRLPGYKNVDNICTWLENKTGTETLENMAKADMPGSGWFEARETAKSGNAIGLGANNAGEEWYQTPAIMTARSNMFIEMNGGMGPVSLPAEPPTDF